jgi:hypothetical protein
MFIQLILYLISAKQNASKLIYIKSNKRKKALKNKGLKLNKKQRTTK